MAKSIMDKIFGSIVTRNSEPSRKNDYLSNILSDRKEDITVKDLFSF